MSGPAGAVPAPLWGAIDFGGTKTALALVAPDGGVRRRLRFQTPPRPGPEQVVARIAAAWKELLAGVPAAERPTGAGVAAPGPADAAAGVLRQAFDWGWHDVPLAALIGAAIGLPVRLDNDVNACALAELRFGAAAGVRDFAWIQLSTGVGGALVCGGRVYTGATGLAGEVGHMVLEEGGPACACGRRGCVQALVSGPAIARRHAERAGAAAGAPDDARPVFAAAAAGDGPAREVLDAVATDLGRAVALVVNLLNPALVVVGGGVMDSLHPWLPAARAAMRERVIGAANRQVEIRRSAVGYDAPLLGAAALGAGAAGQG